MLLTETCYYLENQVFGGVNNRDMSLTELTGMNFKQCDDNAALMYLFS